MKKVLFFQPYIQKWRYDFLLRFIEENKDTYKVSSLYGKNEGKQKKGTYKNIEGINAKGLLSLPVLLKIKNQEYPVFFSPFLLFNLIKIRPDTIITEGEINIFNNIQIELYCKIFRKEYLWWSLGKVRNRKENIVNKITKPIIAYYLKRSKAIIARNTLAKTYYLKSYKIKENKIIVAPNSLNEKDIQDEIEETKYEAKLLKEKYKGRKIILFSGTLIKGKRIEDLLSVIEELKDKYVEINILLFIIGEGPERSNLERIVKTKQLNKYVIFTGAVYEGVSKYFSISDLVVLPGMGGLVIHHAMIHGKPIITRIADGVEEDLVFDGYNGYILRDYDNTKLFKATEKIILDTELAKKMGENSKNIVDSKWNMKIMIDKIIEGIES